MIALFLPNGFHGQLALRETVFLTFFLHWSHRNRDNRLYTAMKKKEEKETTVVEEEAEESQASESEGWNDGWNKIMNRTRIVG